MSAKATTSFRMSKNCLVICHIPLFNCNVFSKGGFKPVSLSHARALNIGKTSLVSDMESSHSFVKNFEQYSIPTSFSALALLYSIGLPPSALAEGEPTAEELGVQIGIGLAFFLLIIVTLGVAYLSVTDFMEKRAIEEEKEKSAQKEFRKSQKDQPAVYDNGNKPKGFGGRK
eukprot:CAMPEP_0196585550 /NCGR_PEP_ID=MMETSP1081-20130531/51108_1 /TAXON_ID=36882 /ORGANISM="Pyramimonas amylifera, Strain CCMP720" /LENGTH=171 /DNA_ID=CAMNT_0041907137 /DNA_START=126 /DNA_END=642 /DNA_ORIENTATION=+